MLRANRNLWQWMALAIPLMVAMACQSEEDVIDEDLGDEMLNGDEVDGDEDVPYTNYSCGAQAAVYGPGGFHDSSSYFEYNNAWCGSGGWHDILAAWQCEEACGCDKDASYTCYANKYVGPANGSYFTYAGVDQFTCAGICDH